MAEMLFPSTLQLQGAATPAALCWDVTPSTAVLLPVPPPPTSAGMDVQTLLSCLLSCDTTLKCSDPGPSRPGSVPPLAHSIDPASSNGKKQRKK